MTDFMSVLAPVIPPLNPNVKYQTYCHFFANARTAITEIKVNILFFYKMSINQGRNQNGSILLPIQIVMDANSILAIISVRTTFTDNWDTNHLVIKNLD